MLVSLVSRPRIETRRPVSYLMDVRNDLRVRGVFQLLAVHLQDFIPHFQVRLVRWRT
jgi:hypothetical protein